MSASTHGLIIERVFYQTIARKNSFVYLYSEVVLFCRCSVAEGIKMPTYTVYYVL